MTDILRARPNGDATASDVSELARNAYAGLKRNLWIVALGAAIFGILGTIYVTTRSEVYVARTALIIDPRIGGSTGGAQPTPGLFMADALVVDSEIEVLNADRLLYRVALRLPASEAAPVPGAGAPGWLGGVFGSSDAVEETTEAQRNAARVRWIRQNLNIEREGATYIISLQFRSQDPSLAAFVVNALAEEYLALQAEDQIGRATQATDWLNSEILRLSESLADLEAESQNYRIENDIPLSETDNTVIQEIADIDARTIAARSAIREANSELQSIELDLRRLETPLTIGSLASLALEEDQLGQLQDELLRLQEQSTAGNGEANLTRFLDRLVTQIRNSLIRLRDTREALVAVARANLTTLGEEREILEREVDRLSLATIPLNSLERRIASLRNQYSVLSNRLRESEGADRFVPSIARIVDPAVPPEEPTGNQGLMTIIASIMGGTLLATGFVFLREQFDDRIRGSRDVADVVGLPSGGPIPILPERFAEVPPDLAPQLDLGSLPEEHGLRASQLLAGTHYGSSLFAETLRRATILLRDPSDDRMRGALVTSARSGDGKTVFAANLAAFLAERGTDVLLVDGDPQTATLSHLLGGSADAAEETAGDVARIRRLGPHLRLLYAASAERGENADPSEYVGAVKTLLHASDARELVLIDAGPLTTPVEDLIGLPQVEKILLVLKFGETSASALRAALRQRPLLTGGIAGTFISHVCERRLDRYEPLPR